MPHEAMNEQQVADYTHLDLREVRKLAARGQIPCRKLGRGFVFRKGEVDTWLATRIHTLDKRQLAVVQEGVSRHHGLDHEQLLVCPMIPPKGAVAPLAAKTRGSVLRSLVDIAAAAGCVHDRERLAREVSAREELCSTALFPGVAMPHPRHPLPGAIEAGFVIAALTSSGVPYGAEDGSLTRLFFLIGCKDERTHLHVLARLAQMLHEGGAVADLLSAADGQDLAARLLKHEESVVEGL